jgi:hypothetical protein
MGQIAAFLERTLAVDDQTCTTTITFSFDATECTRRGCSGASPLQRHGHNPAARHTRAVLRFSGSADAKKLK